jgi:signal transduction histidine kinase
MRVTDSTGSRPARILIVEDDPLARQVLEVMLSSDQCVLLTAASGEEALAIISLAPPDLVLLDVMLPGLDGYQVTARIKGNPQTKNIPVIIVTAHDDHSARLLGLQVGAEDFLTKPVDGAELSVRVRNLLRLRSAIAEADAARIAADRANSAKTHFLGVMSHELRTPLTAITGYAELLEMGVRGPVNPEQLNDLSRIKRASAYLLRLINDVLTHARNEGTQLVDLRPISVSSVLDAVRELCAIQAREKGMMLLITPSEPDIVVTADAARCRRILVNLVMNAIKYSPAGSTISVTSRIDDAVAEIRVADTGVGIRPADMVRVFEPFVQLGQQATVASEQGVGLGLAISLDLARAMGGDITLESREGVGSTFMLSLPLAERESMASPAQPTRQPQLQT